MSKIAVKNSRGEATFSAFSNKELLEAKNLARRVSTEIPDVQTKIAKQYPRGTSMYYFELGHYLSDFLVSENIPQYERRDFWQEVKSMTADLFPDKRAGKSNRRSSLEIAYLLYAQGPDLASKFRWNEWCDLFGREGGWSDTRFFSWLATKKSELTGDDFRQLLNLMTLYTDSFNVENLSDQEVTEHYESLLLIIQLWKKFFKEFFNGKRDNLSAARNERYMAYRTRYARECFASTLHLEVSDYEPVCREIFKKLYVDVAPVANKVADN
jgi:hypothetical protein